MSSSVYNQVEELHKRNPQRKVIYIDSISTFRCINNNVLVKIKPDEYETVHGLIIGDEGYLDELNRYNPAMHAVRHGTIVAQPDHFTYHENGTQSHKTTIETKLGDDVYFDIVVSTNCPLVICDNEYYLLVEYEVLYLAKRLNMDSNSANLQVDGYGFDVVMLNGYLLCQRMYSENTSQFRINDTKKTDFTRLKVIFAGTPVEYRQVHARSIPSTRKNWCKGYSDGKLVPSNPEIKAGDVVLPSKVILKAEVMLEDELHLHFDKVNMYRIMQRKYVDAIYEEDN